MTKNSALTLDDMLSDSAHKFVSQESADVIKTRLLNSDPCMIARFGSYELACVTQYRISSKNSLKNSVKKLLGRPENSRWSVDFLRKMSHSTGFFPPRPDLVDKFARLMIEDMKQVDILGSWLREETYFDKELSGSVKVHISDLEPYCHANPWSESLAGRKVLVVHPFEESIKKQYAVRKSLFADQRVLPDFELLTLKSVQTICDSGTTSGFADWFQALDYMKNRISSMDFDVALIGCGAYGFPLAAHVKRIGKKAAHLGGATQMLFGIKGKRWESHDYFARLINESWIRPSMSERPPDYVSHEGGCYW